MSKPAYILFSILLLLASCRKAPAIRRTEIYGTVTHIGKNYPESNVRVVAVYYYKEPFAVFAPIRTKTLDSAITDANGRYSMDFSMDINADSIMVYCEGRYATAAKPFIAGKINKDLDLSVSSLAPVIVNNLHIINNLHPPLVVFYNTYDSILINRDMDTSISYAGNSPYPYSPAINAGLSAYITCYYYKAGVKENKSFSYFNLPYADTTVLNTVVDASIFTP